VWNIWVRWLEKDNFSNIHPLRSAQQHALELRDIIDSILEATGHEQVNIVAHSKGALDARG
jgi:triacylglycerol esterase/lipase EstA (alpha/beta hydrolase family)